jgi:CheY-like chemotaxis protein
LDAARWLNYRHGMMSHPVCVLVDDDPDFISFVRVCLWRVCPGLEIQTFSSGAEALGFMIRHHADLLLTDFRMPGLDGLGLTREVRAAGSERDVPIVIMSGDDIESAALASGADVFVPKNDLMSRLTGLLQRFGVVGERSRLPMV